MRPKLLSALIALCFSAAAAQGAVTDSMIVNDAGTGGDVLSWGLGTQGQRYSPLRQVNTSNVARLAPAWAFSFGGEKQRGQESQPVIHDGKMFVTASYSRLFALDAATGKKLWKYEHRLPEGIMPCCDVINRGAALYDNLVIFATLDAQIVALNQDTGDVEVEGEDRRLRGRLLEHRGADHRQRAAAHRRVGRRVRRRRPRRGARREDRAPRVDAAHHRGPHGLHLRRRGHAEGERHLGHDQPVVAGRPVEDRRRSHLAGRDLRRQDRPCVLRHRQSPRRGTVTCARATTCTRARRSPST